MESKSLEEKLRTVGEEVQQAKAKVKEVQQILETERIAWTNDKKTLEGTIIDLSTSERVSENDRNAHEREIRGLEQRAVVGFFSFFPDIWTPSNRNDPLGRRREIRTRGCHACRGFEDNWRPQTANSYGAGNLSGEPCRGC